MDDDLPLFSPAERALIKASELAGVDVFAEARREDSHNFNLKRTCQRTISGIVALRLLSVPVDVVCEVFGVGQHTVQRAEVEDPQLVATLGARLSNVALRTAHLATEQSLAALQKRPGEPGYVAIELRERVEAAKKLADVGLAVKAASAGAAAGAVAQTGGFEEYVQALKRVREVSVDVASSGPVAICEGKQAETAVGAGAGAGGVVAPADTEAMATGELGRVVEAGDRVKGGGGVAGLTGGGGDGPMQPGAGNFVSEGEGNRGSNHGVA